MNVKGFEVKMLGGHQICLPIGLQAVPAVCIPAVRDRHGKLLVLEGPNTKCSGQDYIPSIHIFILLSKSGCG